MKKDMPPIGLTDEQLKLVMTIARPMSPAQRTKFLQLVAQQLRPRGIDVGDAIDRALANLQPVA